MTVTQMSLDLAGRPSARIILDRIRAESRDEAEKGRLAMEPTITNVRAGRNEGKTP